MATNSDKAMQESHSPFLNGLNASEYLGDLLGIESKTAGLSIEPSQLLLSENAPEMPQELSRPLVIELYAGSFGWSCGCIAEGFRSIGFDIEHQDYHGPVPQHANLVLKDVLELHGAWFRNAALIVASPPCQAYSYRAMPWKRAKALPPPDNTLFDACFRIQREACEAAGRHIPLIVENVRGAQKWVGRAKSNVGPFYFWGDVPALMPTTKPKKQVGDPSWFYDNYANSARRFSSKSKERQRWSAEIARIPREIAIWIARCFKPVATR